MAEGKTYKGMKGGYYGERHEAKLEYYEGPWDKTHGHGEQNPADGKDRGQFGDPEKGGDS